MKSSRYDFFLTGKDEIGRSIKTFLDPNFLFSLSELNFNLYKIPVYLEYRPDLIAKKFYGNHKLYWVLVYFNNVKNSPEFFEKEKVIKIPLASELFNLI